MHMLVEGLGKEIENVTTEIKLSTAKHDIRYGADVIEAGTVAGQEYEWTAWVDGKPFVVYHCVWKMGDEDVEPKLDCSASGYRVVLEGDPPMELNLAGTAERNGGRLFLGIPWTAMLGVNVIPDVCDAGPGVLTHFDLGVVRPRGLVRP